MKAIMTPHGTCSWEGCDKPATDICKGRERPRREPGHPGLNLYCKEHGKLVADEGSPEYRASCPNCGCHFGVN